MNFTRRYGNIYVIFLHALFKNIQILKNKPGRSATAHSTKPHHKDYAETTMNELLGWYGYEKVDSRDTQGLNLTHFASNNPAGNPPHPPNGVSPPSSAMEGSDGSEEMGSHHGLTDGTPSRIRDDSASPGVEVSSTASDEVARLHQQMVSALSSVTKHPGAPDSPNLPPGCIVCAWCQKVGMKLFTLKTPNGCKAFCSELCFTQCRRAAFKKNKICDWCKHVRHTVNYVDFQDGEQQLQFCSDKCLNQYKMNIFCKETQAHLQMHTHLKEAACKMKASGSVNLITPELWLRDCKINGIPTSPISGADNTDDMNSDDNLSAVPSPTLTLDSSRPSTPIIKDKTEQKQDTPPQHRERDKSSKKSSRHSPKKNTSESKSHHSSKHFRDKKPNGMQFTDTPSMSRHSPVQAPPPSHSRSGQMTNGTPSLLSPPPLPIQRPPHHMGTLPPRHCPPPVPMGGMEPGRQSFMHPNSMPPPFHFLAQQQMEAILRSQHGLDLRSKAPPHMPIPPWVMPPFPPIHPPSQPPIPPSISSSKSPSLSHSSPPARNHYHQSSSHKSSHHSKHKHNKRSSSSSVGNVPQSNPTIPTTDTSVQFPSTLLPPVTVMVPFPLFLPVPLPVPIPIPIPPDVLEKYKNLKQKEKNLDEKEQSKEIPDCSERKRKLSQESAKSKRGRRNSLGEPSNRHFSNREILDIKTRIHQDEQYHDQIEKLSLRVSQSQSFEFSDPPKVAKIFNDTDIESRSYSPLSEALSSNEEEDVSRTLKHSEPEPFPVMNFSTYNLSLSRSSPSVTSVTNDQLTMMNNNQEYHKSPSPTNLSVRERQQMSSSAMNFKKKHLREQFSLMT